MNSNASEPHLDRTRAVFATHAELEKKDKAYWAQAPAEEKFAAITRLREYFYGPEATTGRLQRVYTFFKHK
jgi:hypothetical protein